MLHLFGNILTHHGSAANNRGESDGNITPLQKLEWKGETHTTVSAEAIRWALRYYWQKAGYSVNRRWNDEANEFAVTNPNFDPIGFIDDDVLGFMRAEGAKAENSDEPSGKKKRSKGTILSRRGILEVTRAVSSTPYNGDITFNAVSGAKSRTSLYGTEVHATRYQYGFAMTPDRLNDKSRVFAVLDGLVSLSEVAGNHARFLYDFSPEILVLRWTHDFSPRLLYCFQEDETRGSLSVEVLVDRIDAGDVDPKELWAGGSVATTLSEWGVNAFPGVKAAVEALKQVIRHDMQLPQEG
ncbi:type I-B CRISPR-associated protein Cas7/Cst2/DevR [Leptolyngbya sp. AN02str]|uniref:type I-B CRISPR-associated protein Cas7/Cst2/DevR n=1 Tax=Leptolyngbya sp. AN02str TaxID=3423363 RepID=UPI003D315918